jgi:TorA maturation chaperone TorD
MPLELDEQDRARAGLYALLARLYYGGPDAHLLDLIARARGEFGADDTSTLVVAWQALAGAAAGADPAAVQQHYDDLLVGTGRAEVSPYATFYLAETGREKILAGLRAELDAMGLSRKETSHEPEDHFAGLFDVMRHLVERGSGDAALQDQRRFFDRYIKPSYAAFCAALERTGRAEFYTRVAALTQAFLDVEKEALHMA